ncbi:hypothetical protein CN977_26395 [Bacillus thuringiensis]|uniref:hypothetical protein n=2 Tax=Bacillus cereus group TaxID=86661 RepID=UPI000BFCE41A|nr:hypothetical protein [Bacillus cereus]MBR9660427.1 hypothetical protein [Bacillus cereus]MED2489227.1 hypothetical protein [Bacillus thuringiensis]PGO37247.1 hypothetical protein CN977_26395 [Bacillus thuringiensis]
MFLIWPYLLDCNVFFIGCCGFILMVQASTGRYFLNTSVCEREIIGVDDDMTWMISEFANVRDVTVWMLRYYKNRVII